MADLVITASAVLPGPNTSLARGTAGAAITAGQPIYRDTADLSIKPSDANAPAPANKVDGMSLNNASAGQPVDYTDADDTLTLGPVLTAGMAYFLSATAGKICPAADLATGMTGICLGVAKSTTVLNFKPLTGGVVA